MSNNRKVQRFGLKLVKGIAFFILLLALVQILSVLLFPQFAPVTKASYFDLNSGRAKLRTELFTIQILPEKDISREEQIFLLEGGAESADWRRMHRRPLLMSRSNSTFYAEGPRQAERICQIWREWNVSEEDKRASLEKLKSYWKSEGSYHFLIDEYLSEFEDKCGNDSSYPD